MADSQRTYVDLLFRSSKKYASWDPEVEVRAGDWGRITAGRKPAFDLAFWRRGRRMGVFIKEGNIYDDGLAKQHGIPEPKTYGGSEATDSTGVTWLVSQNAREMDASVDVSAQTPVFAQCGVKASFKFTSGQGAVLAMDNDAITTIDPPGSLRRLLDEPAMKDAVIVSEVHACASYARYLGTPSVKSVSIGISAEPPVANVGAVSASAAWMRSTTVGNFKSKVNKKGQRVYYPLFRLASTKERDTSTGLRGSLEDEDHTPLPDAEPPWIRTDAEGDKGEAPAPTPVSVKCV
ncbi:hypothetical protein OF83DRAFT_1067686 [Amylostereum chailletii]|nr:hypothetical protein OF83DRAFT_1067686 [Amylostereum chailletii]